MHVRKVIQLLQMLLIGAAKYLSHNYLRGTIEIASSSFVEVERSTDNRNEDSY
jgi:hypothetical protein|tara:strand:+ start:1654 stop:1812 length:159 start_codon:yes stop_codon:yes gene_type:complete